MRRWGGVAALLAGVAALSVPARAERHVFERPLMGTRFAITCHGDDAAAAKRAADEAFAAGEAINAVASDYLPDSELSRLSRSPGEAVRLSPLLGELLARSMDLARATGGKFDPTLGSLTQLWRETRRAGSLPGPATLAAAKLGTGWQRVRLVRGDPATITLEKGMRLDLGGIAKGFAADRMFDVMERHGFPRTCIAAGGDLRLGDPPPGKNSWRVGLKTFDPEQPDEVVELFRCAVSTSGDLHQYVEIDGKRYSHILDPATGLGLTERVAVSVIAPTATLSDALATAACVAGADNAETVAKAAGATRVIVRKSHGER